LFHRRPTAEGVRCGETPDDVECFTMPWCGDRTEGRRPDLAAVRATQGGREVITNAEPPADELAARELEALRGGPVRSVALGRSWTSISLKGEIDLYNVDAVREALEVECLHGPERVVLDVADVTFLDPTALRVVLAAQQRLGWKELLLVAPSPEVRRALAVSGVDRLVVVCDSAAPFLERCA
jgi:anti-anti-sigma factor